MIVAELLSHVTAQLVGNLALRPVKNIMLR